MTNPLQRLDELLARPRLAPYAQFIRFGMVGVLNTLIQYLIEQLCYYAVFRGVSFDGLGQRLGLGGEDVRVFVVTAIGFVVSVTHAYFWNSRYVFREKGSAAKYLRTVASYALTGLVISPLIKRVLQGFGLPFWAASLLSLAVTVPLNFALNKFWAFRRARAVPSEDKDDHR